MKIVLFALLLFSISFAHTSFIHVPAVINQEEKGALTLVYLNVTPGNGSVSVLGPSSVASSTLASAETAVEYATALLGVNMSRYNFTFFIKDNASVSGPSGGLAFTLLTISALENKTLLNNFTATGVINLNGSIGAIGGVYDKAEAAKEGRMRFMLVPYAQNGSEEDLIYYISQQTFGIDLQMVKNVTQAEQYAFGYKSPTPLSFNLSSNLSINGIGEENISCTGCNASYFYLLTNSTFDFVKGEVENMSSNFSNTKQQLLKNLELYSQIAKKGYLYLSADLAFLDSIDAFTISHSSISLSQAQQEINSVSSYCSSLQIPQMNNNNYEYVIGGELRLAWANVSIQDAQAILNSAQDSDQIIESMNQLAPAYAWCIAANDMFSIANSINGTPVTSSSSIKNLLIGNLSSFTQNLYTSAAKWLYDKGYYPASLYSLYYYDAFSSTNSSSQQELQFIKRSINATYNGIWPSQFEAEAEFYLKEYENTNNSLYLSESYSSALLASYIDKANKQISESFVLQTLPATGGISYSYLYEVLHYLKETFVLLLILLVFAALILIALLAILFKLFEIALVLKERRRERRQKIR
ncbi:MAG: S16 family serine protease [Candidatus Micrarchaeaceae archaeon]